MAKRKRVLRGRTGDGQRIAICVACDGDGKVAVGRGYPSIHAAMRHARCEHCGGLGHHRLFGRLRGF